MVNNLLSKRQRITVNPEDVVETYTKGSGPGGQSVNKRVNAVNMLHRPTGIQVYSHKTRYMEANRRDAMRLLIAALDRHINGSCSREEIKALRIRESKRNKARKSKKKHPQSKETKTISDMSSLPHIASMERC